MKKRITKIITMGVLLSAIGATNVFAIGYMGYKLPARQTNNYTGTHSKVTKDNYIINTVSELENTDTVTFWATDNSKKQISADYDQKKGNTTYIKFTTSGYNKKDKEIILGMENAHWYIKETAFVAGDVDFR